MNSYVVDSWEDDESTTSNNEIIREKSVMLTQMTNQDITDVEKIFKKYDTKNQGFIDVKHALTIFKAAGQFPSLETEQDIINEANDSNTGMVMFPEMITIFKKHWKSKEYALNELIDAVRLFGSKSANINKDDYDENDIIEMTALCEALANFGDKLELKDIQLIEKYIFKADITMEKDIKMQIADFIEILTKNDPKKKKKSTKGKKKATKKTTKK